ncbi:hypothetical protein L4D09_17745 [Photobacterium makurazakiensis]|uniref:hypothetical protein n=1 Tax=Photobacterium makurazakiensis TaxID=2910234 RepID=UPI003D0CAA21
MFINNIKMRKTALCIMSVLLAGCNSSSNSTDDKVTPTGRWMSGDLHVHSTVSSDARDTMVDILYHAFDEFNLDYVFFSNHMRDSSQDHQDNDVGKQLYYEAMRKYELPEIKYLKNRLYADKIINTTFEWDMPGHEHYNIGIIGSPEQQETILEAVKLFEYKFSYQNSVDLFDSADIARWDELGIKRYNGEDKDQAGKHQDAIKALAWLQENYSGSSYGLLNHPLRYENSYTIADIRDLNNAAPDVFFLIEGMVGGQFGNGRGDYSLSGGSAGVFGGVDPVVAKVGGWWDDLLSEGRKIWNVANSDHHFKIREPYTSSYYPGEYAKNYTFVKGEDEQAILEGLRSGQSFAAYGDLINALDFTISTNGEQASMGDEVHASSGDKVTITVRFKSPESNNLEISAGDGYFGIGDNPGVHHVDLIAGAVTGMIDADSPKYDSANNSDAKVVKSFTKSDWKVDNNGFFTMSYTFEAARNEYYRLRGTSLDYNVDGLTIDGEPQRWLGLEKDTDESDLAFRNRVNKRTYQDVWFYSNPVYLSLM